MTAHWEERLHWLHRKNDWTVRNELWDGSRFGELSWFWDPNQFWILPFRCPQCKMVVSSKALDELNLEHLPLSATVQCLECYSVFDHHPKVISGDPRNIALIGHWDG